MAHATKNLYITIHYPANFDVFFQTFLPSENKIVKNNDNGLYTMQYNDWLLPDSGMAYSFVPVNIVVT